MNVSQSEDIDASTRRFLARPPMDPPDVLLTNFLCSGEVVVGSSDGTPQQKLKDILNDKRWTRRMLKQWLKKGPQSKHFSVTPNPEFHAIYLVLLSLLEDQGKQAIDPNEQITTKTKILTQEKKADEERKLNERIMEHFDQGSTWEKVEFQD